MHVSGHNSYYSQYIQMQLTVYKFLSLSPLLNPRLYTTVSDSIRVLYCSKKMQNRRDRWAKVYTWSLEKGHKRLMLFISLFMSRAHTSLTRIIFLKVIKYSGALGVIVCLFGCLLYVPSQQLWSLRDGQFT